MESTGNALGAVIAVSMALMCFVVVFGSVIWTWSDANRHGKTGCLWALIAWFTWPFGVIAYFVLRDREIKL